MFIGVSCSNNTAIGRPPYGYEQHKKKTLPVEPEQQHKTHTHIEEKNNIKTHHTYIELVQQNLCPQKSKDPRL